MPKSKKKTLMFECDFSKVSDDLVLNILSKLEEDPRDWARVACVSSRFCSLIRNVCCKAKCSKTMPDVVSDLFSGRDPPGGWASMYKLAVCCPGLVLSGVLLENSDFGLERELGPEDQFRKVASSSSHGSEHESNATNNCCWSLYDDLIFDTMFDESVLGEARTAGPDGSLVKAECDFAVCKKKRVCRSHLASGVWNLSREQGNKLLASRFKGDCLYICNWPGCIHLEEKRNYMLFRGVFKNFKQSRVWRTINDGKRKMIDLNCEFCGAKQTWDLHSAFCLRSHFGYHDDGDPVVRAYVCENGHVSGAWTDWPLYT